MLRSTALIFLLVLWGCGGSQHSRSDCASVDQGEGTYTLSRVGKQADSVVTVRGTIADVDQETPIESAAQSNVRFAGNPDSIIAGAEVGESGRFSYEFEPSTAVLQAEAVGYMRVKTEAVTFSPGSVWEVRFLIQQTCPLVEPDF